MIEAVSSVVSNAPLLRGNVEQTSSVRPNSADISGAERQRIGTPVAPYISPFIYVNNQYNKAVLQIRDSDTGDVLKEFPSESTLRARASESNAQLEQQTLERPSQREARELARIGFSSNIVFSSGVFDSEQGASVPSLQGNGSAGFSTPQPRVAEAQLASAALASGATSGQSFTGQISVTA